MYRFHMLKQVEIKRLAEKIRDVKNSQNLGLLHSRIPYCSDRTLGAKERSKSALESFQAYQSLLCMFCSANPDVRMIYAGKGQRQQIISN